MPDKISLAADQLAKDIESSDYRGLIIQGCGEHEGTVYCSKMDAVGTGILASALDNNPELIKVLLDALQLVRQYGNSREDAAFNSVIFAMEGAH